MTIDPFIFKAIIWIMGSMVAVMAFIGGLTVKALWRMADDIGEIKTSIAVHETNHTALKENHEDLKSAVEKLDDRVEKIHGHVFKVKY